MAIQLLIRHKVSFWLDPDNGFNGIISRPNHEIIFSKDKFNSSSINLLARSGIDFARLAVSGIEQ